MNVAERMRANAALLEMMTTGEVPMHRADLRSLVSDLRNQALEVERMDLPATRNLETLYQSRAAA